MRVYIMTDRQFAGSLLTEKLSINRMNIRTPQRDFSIRSRPSSISPEKLPKYYKRLIKERICVPEN